MRFDGTHPSVDPPGRTWLDRVLDALARWWQSWNQLWLEIEDVERTEREPVVRLEGDSR